MEEMEEIEVADVPDEDPPTGSQAAGRETLVVIGNGIRTTVESARELIFLGWTGA